MLVLMFRYRCKVPLIFLYTTDRLRVLELFFSKGSKGRSIVSVDCLNMLESSYEMGTSLRLKIIDISIEYLCLY
jgi:hypothetical protein